MINIPYREKLKVSIIQISKIQIRRGQTGQTNFPQLASGEFGWSIDQQELYIGNGSVAEGSPAVGNTKILTQSDINNLFLVSTVEYQYRKDAIPTVLTGPDASHQTVRSIQDRLDDQNNLNNFITADDIDSGDYTAAIQRAIDASSSTYAPIDLPAGTFLVTATIYLPPFAELRGAGTQKTVIINASTSTMFQTQDVAGRKFSDGGMGSSGDWPRNINICGITFMSPGTVADPILRLDCLLDSTIKQCEFLGNTSTFTTATNTMAAGIELRGQGALNSDNIVIEDCVFNKLSDAVVSNYDINNIKISKNKFKELHRGIVLAEAVSVATTGSFYGPTNVSVIDNAFTNINRQALYAGATTTGSNITSIDNTYDNVGNSGSAQGDLAQATDVITFASSGNTSQGDKFSRLAVINASTSTNVKPIISGPATFNSQVSAIVPIIGTNNDANPLPVLTYPWSTSTVGQSIVIDYILSVPSDLVTRRGQLTVLVNATTPVVRDEFSYVGLNDGNVKFTATINQTRGVVIINRVHTIGPNGTLTYTYTVRQ